MQKYTTAYLRQKRQRPTQQLKTLDSVMLRGSLIERYKRCGKPNCKCATGKDHGPKFYLSVSQPKARPVMIYIPQQHKDAVEKALEHYRKAHQIINTLSDINREIFIRKKPF